MTRSLDARIGRIESALGAGDDCPPIAIIWRESGVVTVGLETISLEEYERRRPARLALCIGRLEAFEIGGLEAGDI